MTTKTHWIALLTSAALIAATSAQAAGLGSGIGAGSIGTPGAGGSTTTTVTPPSAGTNPSGSDTATMPQGAGSTGVGTSGSVRSSSQAVAMLQARGYTNVTNLRANNNGSYTATAKKNGQLTTVTVDGDGNIR